IRGPCPVLNTLANHGYLPRSGANITFEVLQNGLVDSINLHPLIRNVLVGLTFLKVGQDTPDGFIVPSLRDLKLHDFIEHDFSLSRKDGALGDPVSPDPDLLKQLEQASSKDDMYTLEDFAKFSNMRIKDSLENNPEVSYSPRLKAISQMEMASLFAVFGHGDKISKQTVMDIFSHERLPKD
ncbi:Cloroperoxidase, partial [Basidiobolus meristosporus CBS 931.73]